MYLQLKMVLNTFIINVRLKIVCELQKCCNNTLYFIKLSASMPLDFTDFEPDIILELHIFI